MRTLQCTVPAAFDGRPLKHLLRGELGISSTLLKTLKWHEGAILLNGAGVHVNAVVRTGDTVTVVLSERAPRETDVAPLDIPLAIVYEDEELLGGWAKVYRKDRTRPSYEEVKLTEYDTGKSLWKGKKATMIRKVALVHALREAFPSTFGSLYDESEVHVLSPPPWSRTRPDRFRLHAGPASRKLLNRPML